MCARRRRATATTRPSRACGFVLSSPDGRHRDPLFGATSVRRPLANDSQNSITYRDLPGEGQPRVSESAVTEQRESGVMVGGLDGGDGVDADASLGAV
jgi:hypothetical protein